MSVTVASRTTVKGQTSVGGFSPASLFLNNEQGVWYDPSDMTTMFQDFTGTTPVTAVEQPVGLLLDKSKGLILGSELVTNGDFSNGTTGWSAASWEGSVISSSGGQATISYPNDRPYGWAYQSFSTVIGATYTVSGTIVAATGNPSFFGLRKADNNDMTNPQNHITFLNSVGSVSGYKFIATSTTTYIIFQVNGSGATITVDNISIKLLPGNHATQSTSANRPVLSARVNLLTQTQTFATDWANPPSITSETLSPVGDSTAYKIALTGASQVYQAKTFGSNLYTASIYVKKSLGQYFSLQMETSTVGYHCIADLDNGIITYINNAAITAAIQDVGNGWKRISISNTSALNIAYFTIQSATGPTTIQGTATYYVWGPDFRVTNQGANLPVYQRVGAATYGTSTTAGVGDYDTTNFPMYLKFDGSSDFMVTNNIDFSSVNAATISIGIRKNNDTNIQIIYELSTNFGLNNGSFLGLTSFKENVGLGSYWSVYSKGTTGIDLSTTNTYPAPQTVIHTGTMSISTSSLGLRINGIVAGSNTSSQGTGNYGNYPLYIGARAGSTYYLNGNLYGLIIRGASSNTLQIAGTENWLNQKTKAYA